MSRYRIEFDRSLCVGCQSCVGICDNWEIDSEGKSRPKKIEIDEQEFPLNEEASRYCPTKAFRVLKID